MSSRRAPAWPQGTSSEATCGPCNHKFAPSTSSGLVRAFLPRIDAPCAELIQPPHTLPLFILQLRHVFTFDNPPIHRERLENTARVINLNLTVLARDLSATVLQRRCQPLKLTLEEM